MIITSITTAIMALLLLYLGSIVALHRKSSKISIHDGGDKILMRKIRAHGNFVEYTPISLILIALIEFQEGWALPFALILILARGLHAYSFLQTKGSKNHYPPRRLSVMMQFFMLLFGAIYLIILAF